MIKDELIIGLTMINILVPCPVNVKSQSSFSVDLIRFCSAHEGSKIKSIKTNKRMMHNQRTYDQSRRLQGLEY